MKMLVPIAAAAFLVQTPIEPEALRQMVEAERAFAALGAEKGVHESFFKYFGEEGVAFNPHPHKFREEARKNPPSDPPPPREFKLEWWPVYGDVAESGDLGYNTGPMLVSDLTPKNRPSQHGYFFSVWRKQADGTWKVAVDMGASSPSVDPGQQDRLRYMRAPQEESKKAAPSDAASGRAELMALEAAFAKMAAPYASYCRLHRPGQFPILGREAIESFIAREKLIRKKSEGIDGGVSASGELAYTYGSYEIGLADSSEKGYFTHVWKRDAKGSWKLVAEVMNPIPAEGATP